MKAQAIVPVPATESERESASLAPRRKPPSLPEQPQKRPGARELKRVQVCKRLDQLCSEGHSPHGAIALLREQDPGLPSARTLYRWHQSWRKGGAQALTDRRAGRKRKAYGWESQALRLWNLPTQPACATVALWLRGEGYETATESRVRRYLNRLPATLGGENAKKRVGLHYYRQNVGPYVVRDSSVLEVGLIYEGDGHRSKTYVLHPRSGGHYRPELILWIDVCSHYVVGFGLSEDESGVSTLYSLSRAIVDHDHVPAAIHVDPGPGFKNKLLLEESTGWLNRLGIEAIYALPGNPKGKGLVEGWFRWFEERAGKRFSSFAGLCRTDNDLRRLEQSIREGRVELPTLDQYADAVRSYIAAYNATYQKNLGAAPNDLWTELVRSPVELPEAVLLRPAEMRTIQRGAVEIFNRTYRAPELVLLEGRRVRVEYDLTDARRVWICEQQHVIEAPLVKAKDWLSPNRIEDLQEKRLKGQEKRAERQLAEKRARRRPSLEAQASAIEAAGLLPDRDEPLPIEDFNPADCLPSGESEDESTSWEEVL